MLRVLASHLDSLGLRPLVARVANFAYPGHRFSVDEDGDWVHQQPEGLIVSPMPHTAPYTYFAHWIRDNWLFDFTPSNGDVIVDVGTGIGEEALVFSKLIGPTGTMLAIEAHPTVYRALKKTVTPLANVRSVHAAVAAQDGVERIDDGSTILTGSVMGGSGHEVPAFTLDTLTKPLPRIDFLRTNIEGAERLMLKGMSSCIQRIRHACISCHDFLDRPETRSKAEVMTFFRDHGFFIRQRPETPPPMSDYIYARAPGAV